MQGKCETILKGLEEAGTVEAINIQKLITKEPKVQLEVKTFFRRLYKYILCLKKKKGNKADVLVQLISCRNLFYNHNPSLTSLLSLFTG